MKKFLLLLAFSSFMFSYEMKAQDCQLSLISNDCTNDLSAIMPKAASNNSNGYNDYLESGSDGYSMSQMGSYITKAISFHITNKGSESITITKVTMKNATTLNDVSSFTDTSLLGELIAGATKNLSITIHEDIDLVYEWEYTYNGETYIFKSWNYDVVKVSSITLDQTELTIKKGEYATLTATVTPDDAQIKDVTWSSSDQSIVSIDATGKMIGLGVGTATITATATDGSGVTAICSVTVEDSGSTSIENYNPYLQSGSDGYSMSQIGWWITKSIGCHITNNGTESIYITKLTWKNASTKDEVGSSTDTNYLGTLEAGATKSLSITIHQNIDLVYEWEYAYKGNTYVFQSWETYASGIKQVTTAVNDVDAFYDVLGRRISSGQKGINIIKMHDGSVKKMIK